MKRILVRSGAFAAATVALLLTLAACGADPRKPALVLGAPHLPATALVYLAERSGCLARGSHPVELRDYPSGRDALAALRKGEVDAAVGYQTPFIFNALEDPSLRILTALHSSARGSYVVGRRDRGILGAPDLRGKRIGYPPRTSADYLVRSLLAYEGLSPADVTLVEIIPSEAAAELTAGRGGRGRGLVPACGQRGRLAAEGESSAHLL
jgi:ABC-type nitrate/sulfonate/bicarbonate transport system substrate-binding protein